MQKYLMDCQRITQSCIDFTDENGGTKIGDLLKRLNKKFNWEAAVTAVTKDRDIDEVPFSTSFTFLS